MQRKKYVQHGLYTVFYAKWISVGQAGRTLLMNVQCSHTPDRGFTPGFHWGTSVPQTLFTVSDTLLQSSWIHHCHFSPA